MQDTTIVNIYKPPPSKLIHTSLPDVPSPALYVGNFNCQHTDWAYKKSNPDGDSLLEWTSSIDATLLYDLKEPCIFYSACWDSDTNLVLAFAKCRNGKPLPIGCILDRFPRSYHRPLLITIPLLVQPVKGKKKHREVELPESKLGRFHTIYQQCCCWPPTSTLHQPEQYL